MNYELDWNSRIKRRRAFILVDSLSLSLSLVVDLTWIVINGLWKDSSLREIYTIFDTLIAGHPDPAFGGLIEYLPELPPD